MSSGFGNFSDDFFINMDLHTSLPLPDGRETVLHFCEAVQKQFPGMTDFHQRENGEYVLEGDRSSGSYRWLGLEARRLPTGAFNPSEANIAYEQHEWVLDRSRYFLGVSHLDVESLDLVYGFNLDCLGNRDEIVHEALISGSRLASFLNDADAVALNFEPAFVIALNDDCSLQARLAVETRNSTYQVRTGDYDEEPISIYFTIRAHPHPGRQFDLVNSLTEQARLGEDIVARVVIPNIVRPIASAIAAAQ